MNVVNTSIKDLRKKQNMTQDELADFAKIQKMLNRISLSADAMRLWLEKSMASGSVDADELSRLLNEEEL
jgi:transcriptional regulator with XRE-family HTH domain